MMSNTRRLRGGLPALLVFATLPCWASFDPQVSYELDGLLVAGVTIGDIDGDGLADVAAANDVGLRHRRPRWHCTVRARDFSALPKRLRGRRSLV